MQLDEALRQITDIRQHMARSAVFRGYRSIPVACSGVLGVLAAVAQPQLVPFPSVELHRYLTLWISVALISLSIGAVDVMWRCWGSRSLLTRRMTLIAIEQFLPCLVVGALLTVCIYRSAPQVAWMLPGLWCLVFALGIFASHWLLPRQVIWVGMYYLACGCGCLLWGRGEGVLEAWQMGISFGGGQLLGAAVLYWTLERNHASTTIA